MAWFSASLVGALALTVAPARAQEPALDGQPQVPPPASPAQSQQLGQPYSAPQPIQPYYGQPPPQAGYAQPGYAQPGYGEPPPPELTVTRPNLGLIISGAVLLGVGWVLDIAISLPAGVFSSSPNNWDTFRATSLVPLAGPWIQLAVKPTSFDHDAWGTWLIIDGIMQAAGMIMLALGIATPRTETVVAEGGGGGLELAFIPRLGPDQLGAGLLGRF